VKIEYSRDSVPLDTAVVEVLMLYKERTFATAEGRLFANTVYREAIPSGGDPEEARP
jgi:hypothetical protein